MSIFTILFTAALVNNFVLSQFLGICPFLGVSKKVETAAGMGGAVVFVITIASFITSLLYNFLLLPNDLVTFKYYRIYFGNCSFGSVR